METKVLGITVRRTQRQTVSLSLGRQEGVVGAPANWETRAPFKGVMGEGGPDLTPTTFWQTGTQPANQTFVIVQLLLLTSNSKLLSSLVLKAVVMGVQLGWTNPPIHNHKI